MRCTCAPSLVGVVSVFGDFGLFFLVNFCLENKRDDFIDYFFCIRVQLLLVVIIMM